MISVTEYIRKSIETSLFFARIMKEHAIFLEAGFVCKDQNFRQEADHFKGQFEQILAEAIRLANGVVTPEALVAQEFFTNNTLPAEQKTMTLSGIPINSNLTRAEMTLVGASGEPSPQLVNAVSALNQRALNCSVALADFKARVLKAVSSCQLFTWLFPHMLDHLHREAVMYHSILNRLQQRQDPVEAVMAARLEAFWNDIMEDHAEFMAHLFDPTEEQLIQTAEAFAECFKQLVAEAQAAGQSAPALEAITQKSITATSQLRDFKKQGTELILACKLKALINPLLADHVTREANYYLRLLNELAAEI